MVPESVVRRVNLSQRQKARTAGENGTWEVQWLWSPQVERAVTVQVGADNQEPPAVCRTARGSRRIPDARGMWYSYALSN